MPGTLPARTMTISISRPAAEVYDFASDPMNLPQWASGLTSGIEPEGEHWSIRSPEGPVRLEFARHNEFGVLDHTVFPPDAAPVYVPMRVVENGDGSEVILTLFRHPGMTEERFLEDQQLVEKDLQALKQLLEA